MVAETAEVRARAERIPVNFMLTVVVVCVYVEEVEVVVVVRVVWLEARRG